VSSVSVNARAVPLARGLVVILLLTVVASIAVSLPKTTRTLLKDRRSNLQIPASVRAGWIPAVPFAPALITFYADHLQRGDSFFIQAPEAAGARASLVASTEFALLPHLMVSKPAQADVILSYQADPRTLHLPFTQIDRMQPGVFAARVVHFG
jgi:hypothetical protein